MESELAVISQSVASLHAEQNNLAQKVFRFENSLNENRETSSRKQTVIAEYSNLSEI